MTRKASGSSPPMKEATICSSINPRSNPTASVAWLRASLSSSISSWARTRGPRRSMSLALTDHPSRATTGPDAAAAEAVLPVVGEAEIGVTVVVLVVTIVVILATWLGIVTEEAAVVAAAVAVSVVVRLGTWLGIVHEETIPVVVAVAVAVGAAIIVVATGTWLGTVRKTPVAVVAAVAAHAIIAGKSGTWQGIAATTEAAAAAVEAEPEAEEAVFIVGSKGILRESVLRKLPLLE